MPCFCFWPPVVRAPVPPGSVHQLSRHPPHDASCALNLAAEQPVPVLVLVPVPVPVPVPVLVPVPVRMRVPVPVLVRMRVQMQMQFAGAGIGDGCPGAWATTGDKVKTGSELELPLSSTAENCSRAKNRPRSQILCLMWTMPSIEAALLRELDLLHDF